MSGPKHLWSGDWQRESDAASAQLADRRATPAGHEPAAPGPDPGSSRRSDHRRASRLRVVSITLATVLVLVGAAYGLSRLLRSSGHGPSSSASVASTPAPRPAVSPPPAAAPQTAATRPVSWLGMEIQTLPPGAAIVETVGLGGGGDRAGLEPGDVILEINHRPVTGASDIGATIQGLPAGDRVPIQVSHGSTLEQVVVTLAAPPSEHP